MDASILANIDATEKLAEALEIAGKLGGGALGEETQDGTAEPVNRASAYPKLPDFRRICFFPALGNREHVAEERKGGLDTHSHLGDAGQLGQQETADAAQENSAGMGLCIHPANPLPPAPAGNAKAA